MLRACYRLADAPEQGEVGHVAGADLQYLCVLHDHLYVVRVHNLGDDLQAEIPRDFGEYLEPLLA